MARGQFRSLKSWIAGAEAVAAATRHAFPRHTHDQFGIGLIDSGAQKSLSGRGRVEAVAGDVITVNPGEVHDGAPIGDGRTWRMVYFEPELIADAIADISEGSLREAEFAHPVLRDAAAAMRFERLFAAAVGDAHDQKMMAWEAEFLTLLSGLLDLRGAASALPRTDVAVLHAKALIDDDPAAPLSLADLAEASGLSRFQLLRRFGRVTGLAPHAYLLQRRIHMARRLIASGASLADAAADCGFADQSHMTRMFARAYGMSPGAYARAVR